MATHVIDSERDRAMLLQLVRNRALPFTVDIVKGRRRSNEQNRLQRLWLNEASEQLGDRTAEELRGELKLTLGVPILRAENTAFREKYDALVRPLPYETKLAFMMEPLDFPVTRLMSTSQKKRYLDEMERRLLEMGVLLTDPERFGTAA